MLYINLVLFHFQAGLNIPRMKVLIVSYLPTLIFSGCNLNHTYFLFEILVLITLLSNEGSTSLHKCVDLSEHLLLTYTKHVCR